MTNTSRQHTTASRRQYRGLLLRAAFVFAPLITCICVIAWFAIFSAGPLLWLNRLQGNDNIPNDVLLAFTAASYISVAFSLIVYYFEIGRTLNSHIGGDVAVYKYSVCALLSLLGAAVMLGFYIFLLTAVCAQIVTVSFVFFSQLDRYLSVIVFVLFTIADVLVWRSQILQRQEAKTRLAAARRDNNEDERVREQLNVAHSLLLVRLSRQSVVVISLPTLCMVVGSAVLVWYLSQLPFHHLIDASIHNLPYSEVPGEWFELFLEGLESGITVATLFFSQLVYLFIQTRYDNDRSDLEAGIVGGLFVANMASCTIPDTF